VVRALPSAGFATSTDLGVDLRTGLAAAVRKRSRVPTNNEGER